MKGKITRKNWEIVIKLNDYHLSNGIFVQTKDMYPPLLYLTYLKRILQNMPCTTNEILSCQYAFNQVDHLGEFITTDISLSHTFMKLHFQYFFFPEKKLIHQGLECREEFLWIIKTRHLIHFSYTNNTDSLW